MCGRHTCAMEMGALDDDWVDEALTDVEDDAFERSESASRAAALIMRTHSWESSTVFGLIGPWGSGKTTFANFICSQILESDSSWEIVQFTPWATHDAASMMAEFYAALASALPTSGAEKLKGALGTLASISTPLAGLVPFIGAPLAGTAEKLGEHLTKQKPWQEAFDEVALLLREQKKQILLVIDDVDRLQEHELLTLLKVTRLLGRFPGVQYLLAYDDETIFRTLEAATSALPNSGSGQQFMEKIVQYPLVVPPLTQTQMLRRLNGGIEHARKTSQRTQGSEYRVSEAFDVFRNQLRTPRAIDRYSAQLAHSLAMLSSEEVNDEDVMLLTLLKVAFPVLHSHLPFWRSELLTGGNGEMDYSTGPLTGKRADFDRLLACVPSSQKPDAMELLVAIFPKVSERARPGSPDTKPETRRICVETYFDRYFTSIITSDDVSDVLVRTAVDAALDGDGSPLEQLLTDPDPSRSLLAADKAKIVDLGARSPASMTRLITTVLACVPALDRNIRGFFSTRSRTSVWVAHLLAQNAEHMTTEEIRGALASAGDLATELEIWRDVRKFVGDDSDQRMPAWAMTLTSELANGAAEMFLENLRQGDQASTENRIGWCRYFAMSYGDVEAIRASVDVGLEQGEFTIEDVASRVVGIHQLMGPAEPRDQLGDVDEAHFRQLITRDDPWFGEDIVVGVDEFDVSWPSRRRYARGRFPRPVGSEAATQPN